MKNIKLLYTAFWMLAIYVIGIMFLSISFLANITVLIHNTLVIDLLLCIIMIPLFARYMNDTIKTVASSFVLALLIYVVTFVIGCSIYDISYDGQSYHMMPLIYIDNGWNPTKNILDLDILSGIYIQHYPKAYEYMSYVLYSFTGYAEGAKCLNMILMICCVIMLAHVLDIYREYCNIRPKYLFIALIACNPITVSTLFSYYVDGQIASCIVLLFCGILLFLRNRKEAIPLIFLVAVILANLKFTSLFYTVLILAFGFLLVLIYKKKRIASYIYTCIAAGLISLLLVGYNPYVRNVTEHGHIFYPLKGDNSVPVMVEGMMPNSFVHKNNLQRVLENTFSRSRNVHYPQGALEPEFKIPFTFRINEWTVFKSHDVRLGGFGPLWGGIVLLYTLAFILLLLQIKKRKTEIMPFMLFAGFIMLTILSYSEGWYSRYTPHLWLLPLVAIFFLALVKAPGYKLITRLTMLAMTINVAGVWAVSSVSDITVTQEIRNQLQWVKQNKIPVTVYFYEFGANKLRMENQEIPFTELANASDTLSYAKGGYSRMNIQNSGSVMYYKEPVPPYKPSPLFHMLAKYTMQIK